MKKTALVLSGGAFHGAFQVGALTYLKENWHRLDLGHPEMKFDLVSGVSVGTLNGLFVALEDCESLIELWRRVGENGVKEIFSSDFVDTLVNQDDPDPAFRLKLDWEAIRKHFPQATKNLLLRALFDRKKIFKAFSQDFQRFSAFADNSPLKEILIRYAKKEHVRGCSFTCGYVSLTDGRYHATRHNEFTTDEDFAKGVLASTAMPVIWNPVDQIQTEKGSHRQCVDGGIRDVSPLGDVIRDIWEDPDPAIYTIIIINCNSGQIAEVPDKPMHIAQIALRSLSEIAINEIFNHDLKEFIDKNFILKQIQDRHPGEVIYDFDHATGGKGKPLRYFNAIVIQPDSNSLGDSLAINRRILEKRMELGEEKARMAVDKYLELRGPTSFTVT
jgi:NTE family protein